MVEAICDHPDIKAVTFVGSTPVAKLVATRAQSHYKRVVALGGAKNHLVAAPDCNITVTAQDIVNSYTGCAGERCMAASVLLTIGHQQRLVDKIVHLSREIKPGNASGEMGPVIDAAGLAKIERYIAEAEKLGAKILVDGRKWKGMKGTCETGWWIGPTVILHTNRDDPAMKVPQSTPPFTFWINRMFRKKSLAQYYRFYKSTQKKRQSQSRMPLPLETQLQFTQPQGSSQNGSRNAFPRAW